MLRQDLRFFDREENTVGALTSHLDSDAQSIFELMGFSIALIMTSIVTVISSSILAIVTSWKLGLVGVFAGLPPMVLSGYIRIRIETKMDADIDKRFSKSASMASETISAIRTVSSLSIEKNILLKYTAELNAAIDSARMPLLTIMAFSSFTQSIEFFVLGLGFWSVSRNDFSVLMWKLICVGGDLSWYPKGILHSTSSLSRLWVFTTAAKAVLRCLDLRAVSICS